MAAALTTLKQQPGGDIAVGASGTRVRFLLVPLTLLASRAHGNGVVALRYSGLGL